VPPELVMVSLPMPPSIVSLPPPPSLMSLSPVLPTNVLLRALPMMRTEDSSNRVMRATVGRAVRTTLGTPGATLKKRLSTSTSTASLPP